MFLPISLIIDGEVLWDNLEQAGLNEQWLKQQLSFHNIESVKKVLFAEWTEGEPLFVNKINEA